MFLDGRKFTMEQYAGKNNRYHSNQSELYKMTEFSICLDSTRVDIRLNHRDSSISFKNSDRCPTPSLDDNFDFGYHHAFATAFDDIISSVKLRTGPLAFLSSLHFLTTHHALQCLDNQMIHP